MTNKAYYLLSTLENEIKGNHMVDAYLTLQALRKELEDDEPILVSPTDAPMQVFEATKEPK